MPAIKLIFSIEAIKFPLTGIGRYAYELVRQLQREESGVDLKMFSDVLFVDRIDEANLEKDEPATGQTIRNLKATIAKIPLAVETYRFLRGIDSGKTLRGYDDHIFHGPNFKLANHPGPSIVTIHDLSVFKYPQFHPPGRVNLLVRDIRSAIDRANHIVTDSEQVRTELLATFPLAEDRVHVAHLACGAEFQPRLADQTSACLDAYGLTHGNYTLYAGTIEPRKNLSSLLDAYQDLPRALRGRYPLVLAGHKGWNNVDIFARIERGVSEGWVSYLGFVPADDLPFLFAGANLFAFPSHYEGFGLPVLEAMASGVPAVAGDIPCLREVGHEAVLYADPSSVDAIRATLLRALDDEAWRAQAIAKGLARAQCFSWENCARDTIKVYRRAAEGL